MKDFYVFFKSASERQVVESSRVTTVCSRSFCTLDVLSATPLQMEHNSATRVLVTRLTNNTCTWRFSSLNHVQFVRNVLGVQKHFSPPTTIVGTSEEEKEKTTHDCVSQWFLPTLILPRRKFHDSSEAFSHWVRKKRHKKRCGASQKVIATVQCHFYKLFCQRSSVVWVEKWFEINKRHTILPFPH